MALVVEDGTVVANANSYVSLVNADAYFSSRGLTTWTGTDAAKEAALIRALEYMENKYYSRWIGNRRIEGQSLSWPREYAVTNDGDEIAINEIPRNIIYAQCEFALRVITGVSLAPDLERGGRITLKREKVDVLEEETRFASDALPTTRFLYVEELLKPLLKFSGSIHRIVRA